MFGKLKEFKALIAGIVVVFMAGASATVWAIEVRTDVAANTQDRLIRTYKVLELRRRARPLQRFEWIEWCNIRRRLNISQHCPRGRAPSRLPVSPRRR